MRTTISLPDELATQAHEFLDGRSFSDFARESIALRVGELRRERLAREMSEGYEAEAREPSLDPAWSDVEVEGW